MKFARRSRSRSPTRRSTKTYDLGGDTAVTFTIKDADLAGLAAGNAKSLYQHGQLRVDGDVSVAHRLGFLKGLI